MISSGAARARSLAHDVIDRCRAFAEVGVVLEARTTEVHAPQRKQSGDVVSTVVSKVVKRPNKNTYGFLAIKGRPHFGPEYSYGPDCLAPHRPRSSAHWPTQGGKVASMRPRGGLVLATPTD